jgi:UDP-glucose 6-dehydrogenase
MTPSQGPDCPHKVRVVPPVGCYTEMARRVMRGVYRPLYRGETPILFPSRETNELIKYAANAFLATKITFINEIANLCEKVGADVTAREFGAPNRIVEAAVIVNDERKVMMARKLRKCLGA